MKEPAAGTLSRRPDESRPTRATDRPQGPYRHGRGTTVFAVPAAFLLLLLLVAPLAAFVVYSFLTGRLFTVPGPLTIANYTDALTSPLNRTLARNSLIIGVTTATVVVTLDHVHNVEIVGRVGQRGASIEATRPNAPELSPRTSNRRPSSPAGSRAGSAVGKVPPMSLGPPSGLSL